MKIRAVACNNHRKAFQVKTVAATLELPYSRVDPPPSRSDPIAKVFVDHELGKEGFTYVLRSGREGSVHLDHVLEYNQDPVYLRDALLYRLTVEARKRTGQSGLSKRESIRRLRTSATQH